LSDFSEITKSVPEKSLIRTIKSSGGRNNTGRMTVRYIGGGHKRKYRIIDFSRRKMGCRQLSIVLNMIPNRTARIALLVYPDGEKTYFGSRRTQSWTENRECNGIAPEIGNSLPLSDIPLGTIVHNVELRPGQGGTLARSAGTYAQLTSRDGKFAIIRLPSGESRHGSCIMSRNHRRCIKY